MKEKGGYHGHCLPYDILPKFFQDYCSELARGLSEQVRNTYRNLIWYQGLDYGINPFQNGVVEASTDGAAWFGVPGQLSFETGMIHGISSSEETIQFVTSSVQAKDFEPLAHEMLREAKAIRGEHKRSSLLIAISAAETGIKKFIVYMQPDTKWLLENAPSPDLLKLVKEYIPIFKLDISSHEDAKSREVEILEILKKGISIRNRLVHGASYSLSSQTLGDLIGAVEELIWLIDYYSGNEWATRHMNEKLAEHLLTREE